MVAKELINTDTAYINFAPIVIDNQPPIRQKLIYLGNYIFYLFTWYKS
jgi:hypothetical protein